MPRWLMEEIYTLGMALMVFDWKGEAMVVM
jgi:hypothetical protein